MLTSWFISHASGFVFPFLFPFIVASPAALLGVPYRFKQLYRGDLFARLRSLPRFGKGLLGLGRVFVVVGFCLVVWNMAVLGCLIYWLLWAGYEIVIEGMSENSFLAILFLLVVLGSSHVLMELMLLSVTLPRSEK